MTIQNPYPTIGPKLKSGLDYIIANLPLNPTFENLNNTLCNAIYTPNPTNPFLNDALQLYIKSVLPFVHNGYVNSQASNPQISDAQLKQYSDKQFEIIYHLFKTISTTPNEAIPQLLNATDEKIAGLGLSFAEQTPLFVATASGKALYEYWMLNIPQPGTWAAYMIDPAITPQAMDAVNYAKLPQWVAAGMQGALLAYGIIKPPQIQLADIVLAGVGAVALSAGKVVFKW